MLVQKPNIKTKEGTQVKKEVVKAIEELISTLSKDQKLALYQKLGEDLGFKTVDATQMVLDAIKQTSKAVSEIEEGS